MPGNTTRRFPDDRRVARRVPVLFSAVLNRKGWRSQIAEVIDLSDSGAKVVLRFSIPAGSDVVLRVPGAHGHLGVPAVVANCSADESTPVAGLRFSPPDDMRRQLREIVERVDRARRRGAEALPAVAEPPPAAKGGTRVTRRTTKTKKSKKGGPA